MAAGKRKRRPSPSESESESAEEEEGDILLRATNAAAAVARSFVRPRPGEAQPSTSTAAFSFASPARAGRASTSVGSSPKTPRKKRKKDDPDTPQVEKRLARIRKSCPQNVLDRVDRVLTQRFYLVDRERDGDELRETFKVLGSTGNIYTVTVDKVPACNCPDALKGNHCKHILFVMLKVLNVSQYSTYYYQKALLSTELAEIFNNAPSAPSVLAAERVRAAYASASASSTSTAAAPPAAASKRLPEEGDDCPICYESLPPGAEDGLVFCKSCGNGLHRGCFVQWAKTPNGRSCVTCRAAWPHEGAVNGIGVGVGGEGEGDDQAGVNAEGYINVAGPAGISPVRDTSTCAYFRLWRLMLAGVRGVLTRELL
ncbi:hypothetical protein CALCODRAFT_535222 [Calocera cornea HHB12733]|uniref:SWIM-type domain-containing protein n=1 Tax=Calocera cornea HHB12733 TaxID=1353952 RepID=A0A165CIP1_9BASI|nr:hypothetical protein CALCODRAFT_535222 [Calocera cornea HHB12733]